MKPALREAIAQYDEACRAAQRRTDNAWIDKRLASMTAVADDRQAEYAAAKKSLAMEHGIHANLI